MALLAALVIFTVIARYCFSLSWKQLAEFNTTLFAFTTFWGMGINVIKDEHVMIDILYDGVKPARKRWLAIINYLIVLAVVLVFTYQGFKYVGVAGKQISQGMEIPMNVYVRHHAGVRHHLCHLRRDQDHHPVQGRYFLLCAQESGAEP